MDVSNAKGRLLETGVELIEHAILRCEAKLAESEFVITPRKKINASGVHHEIDVHVQLLRPHGYEAIYIFECKNRQDKFDKNDVIVFSEKIDVFRAQRGFVVAAGFTADAAAQAALDPRIEFVHVTAQEAADASEFVDFDFFGFVDVIRDSMSVTFGYVTTGITAASVSIDMRMARVVLDAKEIRADEYVAQWANDLQHRCTPGWLSRPPGEYESAERDERRFESGQLTIDGVEVRQAALTAKFRVRRVTGRIRARIDVDGRGTALQLEPVILGGNPLKVWLSAAARTE